MATSNSPAATKRHSFDQERRQAECLSDEGTTWPLRVNARRPIEGLAAQPGIDRIRGVAAPECWTRIWAISNT
jgi:hypothetical protein